MSEPHCRKMNPRTQKGVHLYDNYCHLLCRCRRHSIRSDFLQKLFLTHSVAVVFTTPGIFFVNASHTGVKFALLRYFFISATNIRAFMSHRFVINEKYIIKIRQPSFEKTKKHAADNYCLQRVKTWSR